MADKKISALTGATTPLAGTEVLPIVQSGATVKVAVSDLTAGRAISATQITLSAGNVIVANGQGVDFSATPSTGTSELFADYEEGTFTPTVNSLTTGNGTVSGRYTKTGRIVTVTINVIFGTTTLWTGTSVGIGGLPFTSAARSVGLIGMYRSGTGWYTGQAVLDSGSTATTYPGRYDNAPFNATSPWVWTAGDYFVISMTYEA
jgi:hypothetical protein